MKLENQLASLEPSKKLRELGVKQESYWCWRCWHKQKDNKNYHLIDRYTPKKDDYSAFTCAELGEMLPNGFYSGKYIDNGEWLCEIDIEGEYEASETSKISEVDARAKMLIRLIENKLIKVEE